MATIQSPLVPDWFRKQEEEKSRMSLTNSELAKRWKNLASVSSNSNTVIPQMSLAGRTPTTKEMETADIPLVYKPENYRVIEPLKFPEETISVNQPQNIIQKISGLNEFVGNRLKAGVKQTLASYPQFALDVAKSPYTMIIKPLVESAYSLRNKEATYNRLVDKYIEQSSLLTGTPPSKEEASQILQSDWRASIPAIAGFVFDFAPLIFLSAKSTKAGLKKTPQVKTVGIEPITKNQLIDHISGRPLTDKPMTPEQIRVVNESGVKTILKDAQGPNGEINLFKLKDTLAAKLLKNITLIERNPNKFIQFGKINTNVLNDIKNTLKSQEVTTKVGAYSGLLPERAGYMPTDLNQPYRIPVGLGIRDVNLKPITSELQIGKPLSPGKNVNIIPIKFKDGSLTIHEVVGKDAIYISNVNVEEKNVGTGSEMLKKSIEYIHKNFPNREIRLVPESKRNVEFYKRFGFEIDPKVLIYKDGEMVLKPTPAMPEKITLVIPKEFSFLSKDIQQYSTSKEWIKNLRRSNVWEEVGTNISRDDITKENIKMVKNIVNGNPKYQLRTKDNDFTITPYLSKDTAEKIVGTLIKLKEAGFNSLEEVYQSVKGEVPTMLPEKAPEVIPTQKFQNIAKEIQSIAEAKKIMGEKPMSPSEVIAEITRRKTIPNIQMYGETPGLKPIKPAPSLRKLKIQPPVAPEVTSREDVLLRQKLRLEQRAGKLGYKTGVYETRIKLIDQFRITQENIKDIKNQVVDYLKENLPLNVRGKFLTMIKDVHTQDGLAKAFFRADKEITNVARKEQIIQLKKNINRINESKQIAIDYKQKINSILDNIEIKGHNQATIDKLKKTNEYIKKQEELGNDVEMPKRILEALEILNRKPLADLSSIEIELLNDKILAIEKLGQTKWRTLQSLYDIEKAQIKQELIENTFPIETREMINPNLDLSVPEEKVGGLAGMYKSLVNTIDSITSKNLTQNEKVINRIALAWNFAQKFQIAIMPEDVFFDVLDGSPGYTGSNYKNIKKRLDSDYGGYLDLTDKYVEQQVKKWIEKYNLNEKNLIRIQAYALRMQEGGMEWLENTGYTKEEVDSVVLTKNEMALYNTVLPNFNATLPLVADTMRTVWNTPVEEVKNYSPFIKDWEKAENQNIDEIFLGNDSQRLSLMPTKKPEAGMTIKRKGAGKQKARMNFLETYSKHMDAVAYLVTMSRDVKMLFEIVNSPEYGIAAGDRGQKEVLDWLSQVARHGGTSGQMRIKILDWLRKNAIASMLGFRVTTSLMQFTTIFDGAALIGGNYAFNGVFNILGPNGKEWRYFLKDNFPELRDRGLDDPAYLDLAENIILKNVQEAGFKPIKIGDAFSASSIVSGAYMQYLDKYNIPLDFERPNYEAISYATLMMNRTQGSAIFKNIPSIIARGGLTGNVSLDKFITTFQNFMLHKWSLTHDLFQVALKIPNPTLTKSYATNNRDFKKAFNIFFWLTMSALSVVGLRRGIKKILSLISESDAKQNALKSDLIREFLTTIPFMGHLVGMAVYKTEPIPGYSILKNLISEGYATITGEGKKKATKLRHWTKFITNLMAFRGIPGSMQVQQLLINATYPSISNNNNLNFENMDFSNINLNEVNLNNINLDNLDFSNINLGE